MRSKAFFLLPILALVGCEPRQDQASTEDIAAAQMLAGIVLTGAERELMLADIREQREAYEALRQFNLPNDLPPSLVFAPGFELPPPAKPQWSRVEDFRRPADDADLAFLSVAELGELLRSGELTSLELTQRLLARIRAHDVTLRAVITVTEELALEQAQRADAELAAGIDRGPLHGIPYGLKDLVAVRGYPTTWGAQPYREQVIEETATVAQQMEDAGAVLIAKTAVGALAWSDVWFDGQTRTPWSPDEGAWGSSAGSAAGVAAGYFPVAIGTETWGSIVSPALRNGVIGLRPTFGRVSRHGVMTLAWSMDKVGALCRHAEDCGMVLDAIRGADPKDATSVDAGFMYPRGAVVEDLRFGSLARDFAADHAGAALDLRLLQALRERGIELHERALPDLPIAAMSFIVSAEAAAAFDAFTRNNIDDQLVRQSRDAWPNVFRAARFIPAVEYLQANRLRHELVDGVEALLADIDVLLAPCLAGEQLLATNLTGHPSLALPYGVDERGMPVAICLIGKPFQEGTLLAAARAVQQALNIGALRPPGY